MASFASQILGNTQAITHSYGPTGYNQTVNPASIKDLPSLSKAYQQGLITKQQWSQRYDQISPTQKVPGLAGQLGSALKQSVVQAVEAVPKAAESTGKKIGQQFNYLSGNTSTQPQRTAIATNQKAATTNPEYIKATQGIKPGTNSASGLVQAQKMAAAGIKAPQIKTFLQKDAQGLANQTVTGVENAATLSTAGQGLSTKFVLGKLDTALGKDEAVTKLINGQKIAAATSRSKLADALGSKSVKESTTQKIPVINSTESSTIRKGIGNAAIENVDRTTVPVKGVSTQTVGKVSTAGDKEYLTKTNQLTNRYNKELSTLRNTPGPVQKFLQQHLDNKYSVLQEQLDKDYGKTSVNFNGKSTKAPPVPGQPRSAFDRSATTIRPTGESSITPKPPVSRPATPSVPGGTIKTSGSALKTEARAIEKGLASQLPDKATYSTVSFKEDAANAAKLINDNPQEAKAIATGAKDAKGSYAVAVRRAIELRAQKEGDIDTLRQLGSSTVHTRTSEAAQTLGSEAYHADPESAVDNLRQVSEARVAAKGKDFKENVGRKVNATVKEIKSEPKLKVSRQDWHNFIESLKC